MDYIKLRQIKNIGYYFKNYNIYAREGLFPVLDLTITQNVKYKSCIDWVYFVKIYDDLGYEINITFD